MLIQEVKEKNWHLFVILYEFYQVDFYSWIIWLIIIFHWFFQTNV